MKDLFFSERSILPSSIIMFAASDSSQFSALKDKLNQIKRTPRLLTFFICLYYKTYTIGKSFMSLKDKVIFMSGGSRGIGLSIALRAAQDGAKLLSQQRL